MDDIKAKFQIESTTIQGGYNSHSRYALFLIEQLLVILVFALCAAVCVSIFADSYIMAGKTGDQNHAITIAGSGAEAFKSVGNNAGRLAELLGGITDGDAVRVYYGTDWRLANHNNAVYEMTLTFQYADPNLQMCSVSVDIIGGDNIITFTVAAQRRGGL
ncbi:MAG: hypothetical protein FWE91_09035 [Defluviitaleaceae bacterium]|nr:hypothetical protein [Defluviitaleaceae bacterium]MCL2837196.1 hypothetical protein [Defluviitaleaceae bacterium]